MIITKIIGGLGNQLFQYAAGRALAEQNHTNLLLDVSGFDAYKLRTFDLAAFNTNLQFAEPTDITNFTNRKFIEKVRDNIFPMRFRKVYKPKEFCFHQRFFKASSSIYLQGYWQSEKFFSPIADLIRKEFTVRDEYIANVTYLANKIGEQNSVSVHIRRGDYQNPVVIEMHGILDANYYRKAIAILSDKNPGAIFYFFSDDMNWARENLSVENAVYVSGIHSKTHLEDFYLMSQCTHNIIANSSFSWWATWLNNNPGKMVIAPKKWFNMGPQDTQDVTPENWLRI